MLKTLGSLKHLSIWKSISIGLYFWLKGAIIWKPISSGDKLRVIWTSRDAEWGNFLSKLGLCGYHPRYPRWGAICQVTLKTLCVNILEQRHLRIFEPSRNNFCGMFLEDSSLSFKYEAQFSSPLNGLDRGRYRGGQESRLFIKGIEVDGVKSETTSEILCG